MKLRPLMLPALVSVALAACVSTAPTAGPASSGGNAAGASPLPATPAVSALVSPPADIIFINANIVTMDVAQPVAQALAIQGDKVAAVGAADEILKSRGPSTVIVDLSGRTLLPGFVDAHSHLAGAAEGSPDKFRQLEDEAIRGGITTTTEMGVDPILLNRMKEFDQSGLIRMRWNTYLLYNTNCGVPFDPGWYRTYKQGEQISQHIRNQGVKVFSDGGSCHVPAVSFQYPGGYGQGDLYMTQDQLTAVVREVQGAGYQVAIHALGDRAIEEAQNAIGSALNGAPNTYRHRIEHNAVLHDSLLPRYNQIGIIPVIFGAYPTCWRTNASSQFKYAVPASLGTWEWPWRALLDTNPGIKAAWHSDFPLVSPADGVLAVYGFVTRNEVAADGSVCQAPNWLKGGAITANEALHIMTINSAYALFRENEVGSLQAGKLADMIILSADPRTVSPEAIKDIHVLMTMIGGKVEYCAAGSESLCPSAASANPGTPTATSSAPGVVTATASQSLPDHPAVDALDGSTDTWWSAGSGPEQWIQVDLGRPTTVSRIRLVISQYPEGDTDHQVWAGPNPNELILVHEFKGRTKDLGVLEFVPPTPLKAVQYVRIVTSESPSWVAWREIEISGN